RCFSIPPEPLLGHLLRIVFVTEIDDLGGDVEVPVDDLARTAVHVDEAQEGGPEFPPGGRRRPLQQIEVEFPTEFHILGDDERDVGYELLSEPDTVLRRSQRKRTRALVVGVLRGAY